MGLRHRTKSVSAPNLQVPLFKFPAFLNMITAGSQCHSVLLCSPSSLSWCKASMARACTAKCKQLEIAPALSRADMVHEARAFQPPLAPPRHRKTLTRAKWWRSWQSSSQRTGAALRRSHASVTPPMAPSGASPTL